METRFQSMIQPIRDLMKNWDVDIAGNLEEYLQELETVAVSFDGGETTMNFAEAAMLLQGAACVYSKKVEYLYTLVCEVLNLLANKKKKEAKSSVNENGQDEDAHFSEKDDDDEFLPLDDIQECRNIWMKEDEHGCKSVLPLPQIPLSLIPLDEGEKGDNPLLSKTGEVLGSRNDFKMNTSCVHQTGTLLLDMSLLPLLTLSLQMSFNTPTIVEEVTESSSNVQVSAAPVLAINENMESEGHPDDIPNMDVSCDDDNSPADEVDGMSALNVPPPDNQQPEVTEQQKEIPHTFPERLRLRKEKNVEKEDPMKLLDPYEVNKKIEKPFKKGLSYKIPECLKENPSKKRRRKPQADALDTTISQYLNYSHSGRNKLINIAKYGPLFLEVESIYLEESKRRQKLLKDTAKKMNYELAPEVIQEEEAFVSDGNAGEAADSEGLAFDHDGGDCDDDNDALPLEDENLFNAIDNALSAHHSVMQIENTRLADLANASTYDHDATEYEELVRMKVEQYLSRAQEYAQDTEISRRVSEWEDKVVPRLQEEETHEPFDINKYGTKVLEKLAAKCKAPFTQITSGQQDFEVCRVFLATLMLANTMNVDIIQKDGINTFELNLLSTTRHFQQLEEYQAPSIANKT